MRTSFKTIFNRYNSPFNIILLVFLLLMFLRRINYSFAGLIQLLLTIPVLLLSLSLHETAHGLAAYWLGDDTAKSQGRLSANPLHHIDWMGFLCLILVGFGWAKPVSVNMYRFKDPKKGMALSALAGPVMNILLVFVSVFLWLISWKYGWNQYVVLFFYLMVQYNAVLAMFNLLPIPPLDGSKVFFALLPDRYYYQLMQYEQYGMLLLLLLIITGATSGIIANGVNNLIQAVFNLVIKLPVF